ncbi:MAG: protein BatD [Bacteroidales bacterium]|nr:protein BatD [Bacteroidales bacterium]
MKKIGFLIVCLMTAFLLRAQDNVSFKVICKKQVVVGEQFQVSYELNGDGTNFEAPNFNNFEIVGGPFSSSSSSVQIVNGSVTRTNTHTYSFYLRAIKEGKYTIPAATITVNKQKVKSTTADIEVVKDNSVVSGSSASGGAATNTKDVFLEAVPNKLSTYLGEQIILTYKIYYTIPISNLSISKAPSYSGFWTKDITENNGVLQQSSIMRNGQEYHVATIQEIVLIPQKTGTLTIDPLDITCIAQIRQERQQPKGYDPFENFFGDIMGSSYTNVKKEMKSQPINIEVKALPTKDKPESFKGAVGQFTFTSKIDKTEMKSNDAFTVTYTVTGKGNIELLDIPRPVFPADFEVYDPKITSNVKNNSFGLSGSKKAEYVVIPRVSGDFTLNPTEFSYFDPSKNKYVTLESEKYELKVERSANEGSSGIIYAGGQEAIKVVGSDIRHIMTIGDLHKDGTLLFGSLLYFIILIAMIAVFAVALIIYKRINKFNQNQVLVRNKKATKIAKKRLQNAYSYLKIKDQNHFYEELSQALWGYISDKLNIARSQLSMDTVKETMTGKNVPEDIVNQFIELLNSCEYARFAPGDPGKKMEDLYQKGIEVITKAEKNL